MDLEDSEDPEIGQGDVAHSPRESDTSRQDKDSENGVEELYSRGTPADHFVLVLQGKVGLVSCV